MAFSYHRGAVDCDAHCAPAGFQDLFPYLSDYRRQYLTEAGVRLTDMAQAYPPIVRGETPHSYAELAQRYLEPAEPQLAVLNCVTGFETHRNPYFSAAVASAINDWLRPGKAPTPSGFATTYLEDYLGNQPIAQAQLLSFVSEGVFERSRTCG
jgi:hypothetical protein